MQTYDSPSRAFGTEAHPSLSGIAPNPRTSSRIRTCRCGGSAGYSSCQTCETRIEFDQTKDSESVILIQRRETGSRPHLVFERDVKIVEYSLAELSGILLVLLHPGYSRGYLGVGWRWVESAMTDSPVKGELIPP